MLRHDYIKRMVEQLGEALARIVGLRSKGQTAEALSEVRKAYAALDLNPHLVASMSGAQLAQLVNDPERARGLAQLLKEDSQLQRVLGHSAAADTKQRQALALMVAVSSESDALDPALAAADAELIRSLLGDPAPGEQ